MANWIDVGGATAVAEDVEYVQDIRPNQYSLAPGMKSLVTLKSGRWFYARYGRAAIIRRVKAAAAAEPR